MSSMEWSIVECENTPKGRDDHAGCESADNKIMYVFGGYVNGDKSNELWQYDIDSN
jgi:hypothetical protein